MMFISFLEIGMVVTWEWEFKLEKNDKDNGRNPHLLVQSFAAFLFSKVNYYFVLIN